MAEMSEDQEEQLQFWSPVSNIVWWFPFSHILTKHTQQVEPGAFEQGNHQTLIDTGPPGPRFGQRSSIAP